MGNYIVYCPEDCEINGKNVPANTIGRTGVCADGTETQQAVYPGEVSIAGTANDATQKVVDGKVVNK